MYVEASDRKGTVAAVRTARPALEPVTRPPLRFREIGIENFQQLGVRPFQAEIGDPGPAHTSPA